MLILVSSCYVRLSVKVRLGQVRSGWRSLYQIFSG